MHLLSGSFRWSWILRMAWRDSRRSRRRLFLYSTAIVLGVAALIAIGSLGEDLSSAIETQSKALLGADLVLASRDSLTPEADAAIASLGGEQAREVRFSSMVMFPKSRQTRLVQVRAVEGGFPFYGSLETVPAKASEEFRNGRGVLVEDSVMKQLGVAPGDPIKIGNSLLTVSGSLQKVPGETIAFSTIAPRVYLPLPQLAATDLLRHGSLVRTRVYFKFRPETDVSAIVRRHEPEWEKLHLESDTVERRKRDLGRAMTNLYHFLNLVGFVALLLGGTGIASAIHVHIKQRLATVAVLRCLGCRSQQAFAIFLVQAIALGLVGVGLGTALGLGVQAWLPRVIGDFVPFQLTPSISWPAIARGGFVGLTATLLFAVLPLLRVRLVSPLGVFRASVQEEVRRRTDPALWACYGLLGAGLLGFSLWQTRRWQIGVGFALGLGVAFAILGGLAKLLTWLLRRNAGRIGSFSWRQGLANLYRPNNRTVLLLLCLGLGTFLVLTLHLLQANLVHQVLGVEVGNRPDAVLFDIQSDQIAGVKNLLRSEQLPVLDEAPIVTLRLASVKGRPVSELRKEGHGSPGWVFRREYRCTYRDHLVDSEKLVGGTWQRQVPSGTSPIPVSLETGIAENLHVGLGDRLDFDLQGVTLPTKVASLREVDWRRLQPNFFVVFPRGVLEDAPSFDVLVTRVGSSSKSAEMQRRIAESYPNVSVIDLSLVLQTVDAILGKITFVVQFMALFTIGTGLLVLVASILSGRHQRLREAVLLRVLGASRSQIRRILVVEYLALGTLAAATGIILSLAGGWAIAHFVFKMPFYAAPVPIAAAWLLVSTLTVLTGVLASRGACRQPPLELLRSEV